MRVLLALLLLAAAPFLAPAGLAKPYCTMSEPGCDGIVCYTPAEACIGEPCWINCGTTSAAPEPACHPLYSGPFSTGDLCVDPSDPKCAVYLATWDFENGHQTRCWIVGRPSAPAMALPTSDCVHTIAGHGWDTYTCYDVHGPKDCKLWRETRRSEGGDSRHCIQPAPLLLP